MQIKINLTQTEKYPALFEINQTKTETISARVDEYPAEAEARKTELLLHLCEIEKPSIVSIITGYRLQFDILK